VINNKATKAIALKLLNKSFQVNCPTGAEEQLYAAADYLEQKMQEIHRSKRVIGLERIAIMAALNISHELLALRQQKEAYTQSINKHLQHLQNKIESVLIANTTSKNDRV
jgi:cell division protein ZapA